MKMKNVMTRAWEIAKESVKKFGGKVKEYFAQALVMAWKEVKEVKEIGYMQIQKLNGNLFFAVNNIEGLTVSFLTEGNGMNGKYTKRNLINDYSVGIHNETQKEMCIYKVSIHCGDLEIKLGDKVEIVKNSYDKAKWGL